MADSKVQFYDPMAMMKCPGGHDLSADQEFDGGVGRKRKAKKMQCDLCKSIYKVDQFVGCRKCNFDVCLTCSQKGADAKEESSKKKLEELLGNTFLSKEGEQRTFDAIADCDAIGIFFWSHTCDISLPFAKRLRDFYEEYKKTAKKFEVVAVTDTADDADDEEKEMKAAFAEHHGDWLTVPFTDETRRHHLHDFAARLLGDSPSGAGPSLLVVGKEGTTLNKRALFKVAAGVDHVVAKGWSAPLVGDLSEGPTACSTDIAMTRALVVLVEQCSKAVKKAVVEALTPLAEKQMALAMRRNPPDPEIIFLVGMKHGAAKGASAETVKVLGDGCATWGRWWTARALRKWMAAQGERCAVPDTRPLMLLIDVTEFTGEDRRGFYLSDATTVSVGACSDFIAKVDAGNVPLHHFDYAAFTETGEHDERDTETAAPVSGCYWGGNWEDFSELKGVGDDEGDSDEGSSDSDTGVDPAAAHLREQFRVEGEHSHEEPLPTNVDELQALVREQRATIAKLQAQLKELSLLTGEKPLKKDEAPQREWRNEDDDTTEASEATPADPSLPVPTPDTHAKEECNADDTPMPKGPWKSEDDDSTDSDDSEVREYRARMAAKKNSPAS